MANKSLGETDRFQFIVRVIIPMLENNLPQNVMLISCFSFAFRFFGVLLEHCQDFKLILRSKQLASVVVCHVITLVIELPNRIVYDE